MLVLIFLFSYRTKGHGSVATDDMKMLNSTVGKLFRHLQISEKTSDQITLEPPQKDVNVLTLTHDAQSEESFRDITLRLRNFEKEFQRQKVHQQKEVMRYGMLLYTYKSANGRFYL